MKHPAILSLLLCALLLTCPALAEGTAGDHLQAAENYMKREQWDYASYEWRAVLEKVPEHLHANLGLASALTQAGYPDQAIEHLERIAPKIDHIDLDLALAKAYLRSGELTEARKRYFAIWKKKPFHPPVFQGLREIAKKLDGPEKRQMNRLLGKIGHKALLEGKKAARRQDYEKAVDYYHIAAHQSGKIDVINDYGIVLLLAGKYRDANRYYTVLLKKKDHWVIYANAAMAQMGIGQSYRAQKYLEEAISLCDDKEGKARLYNNLGFIYERSNKMTGARYAYERALELKPDYLKARVNLAYVYQRLMAYDEAVTTYRRLVNDHPRNADYWNGLGYSYELRHDYKKALDGYRKATRLDPAHKEALFNLGTLYKKMGKMKKSDQALEQLMDARFKAIEKDGAGRKAAGTQEGKILEFVDLFLMS